MNILNKTSMSSINDIPLELPEIAEPPETKTEKDIEEISNTDVLVINNSSQDTKEIEMTARKYISSQHPKTLSTDIVFCRTSWPLPRVPEVTKMKELAVNKVKKIIFIIDQNKKIAKEYIDNMIFGKDDINYEILEGKDIMDRKR